MFWINLPRYVAVILYDSLCRMKLSSCKSYKKDTEPFELWKLTSSQQSQRHNFSNYSNSPILDTNRTVPLLCPPPPLQPKLGLKNLIVKSILTRNPNLEEQIADQLSIARKGYHGKSFEGQQCSKLLSCSASLKELVPPSDPPLVECLEVFLVKS